MATRSPGIYFSETDNTQFTNPKAVTGTTLAVVGYARKGKIGVPVEINSWKDYLSTFGKPLDGYYSGLAVRNFLTAGGSVLFYRVADETASPSNYIVKNPIPATNGHITFARNTDIMPMEEKYKSNSIYAFKLANSELRGNWKYFFIRTPDKGKRLTQASIVNQIEAQLPQTPASFEGTISNEIKEGFYGFNVEKDGAKVLKNDLYIETFAKQSKESLAKSLESSIEYGSNALVEFQINNLATSDGGVHVNKADDDYSTKISGVKLFKISRNERSENIEVDMTVTEGQKLTLSEIAKRLDRKMNDSFGIRVFEVQGDEAAEPPRPSKIVFVSKNKISNENFEITSYTPFGESLKKDEDGNYQDLFVAQQSAPEVGGSLATGDGKDNFIHITKYTAKTAEPISDENRFNIRYDDLTNNFIISTKNLGAGKTIKMVDCEYDTKKELSLAESSNKIFIKSFNLEGQEAININVEKDEDGRVRFENDNTEAPALSEVKDDLFVGGPGHTFGELLEIEKDPTVPGGKGYNDPVVGKDAVPASARDKVIFTSKEKGSGTNNIEVEIYTTVNPTNKNDVKHNLIIYVDGSVKETYENISLNPDDGEDYFKMVLNKKVENGGSAYIHVEDDKKVYEEEHKEIELPDGRYKIGKPNKSNDKQRQEDENIMDYNNYDYSVGTDGIPADDGFALFEAAMEPGTSALANKELYDFHIIIAPDDICENVQNACIALCEDRGDAITIADPPQGLDKKSVIDWHNGRKGSTGDANDGRITPLDSNYVATYWPWCKIYDTSTGTGKYSWVMPSVIMAAQYARIDKTVGCHMAPAGETNGILPVIDIEKYPNAIDRDELYSDYNRVNPITKFKDGTVVAYGEKTTQRTNSVLTKIHTRRMLVQIKKQCREALRRYVFMPNTADYLGKISNNITAILEGYKAKGGLNYYKVICDETNNPTETRQQDIINVDVILVPEGTIEQININLTLNKTAETVTD